MITPKISLETNFSKMDFMSNLFFHHSNDQEVNEVLRHRDLTNIFNKFIGELKK